MREYRGHINRFQLGRELGYKQLTSQRNTPDLETIIRKTIDPKIVELFGVRTSKRKKDVVYFGFDLSEFFGGKDMFYKHQIIEERKEYTPEEIDEVLQQANIQSITSHDMINPGLKFFYCRGENNSDVFYGFEQVTNNGDTRYQFVKKVKYHYDDYI